MTAERPTTPPAAPRNVLVDTVRVLSVAVVIVFHMGLFRLGLGADGAVRASVAEPGVPGAVLSWFVQIMPLFFVAGGYAHAVVVDRSRARGEPYATYLANRVRRFVGPLSTFVGIIGLVATAVAWAGLPKQAVFMSSSLTKVLWFLFIYLFVVTVAPLMVTLQDRTGAVTLAVLLAAAFAVDAWSFTYWPHDPVSAIDVRHLNIVWVWLLCHQLGIAYHRGWWQHWPRWAALASVVVGVAGIWALVGPGPYPYPAVGFGDRIVSNLLPPTAAMALLCLAQTGLLALVDRHDWPVLEGPRTQKVVKALNLLLMTIYLWHVPAVSVGMGVWLLASQAFGWQSWWLSAAVQLAVGLPVLALVAPWIARLDLRLIPALGPHPRLLPTLAGTLALLIGTGFVWRNGLALHPASPYAALGVALITIGALLLRRGADSRHADPSTTHS